MIRLIALMVTLIVSSPVVARSAESDDIKQFKVRFELLETKLKLAERVIQDLKKEIEILKADKQNGEETGTERGQVQYCSARFLRKGYRRLIFAHGHVT